MRYHAILTPPPTPLQANQYGSSIASLRDCLKAAPAGTRVDIYERVEVLRVSFVKGEKDVITETYPGSGGNTAVGPITQQPEPRDEGTAAKK